MRQLTTQFVQSYFTHMLDKFDATLVPRDNLEDVLKFVPCYDEFETIADALAMIGVPHPLAMLRRSSFTVGEFICLNYEPGVVSNGVSLEYQVSNLAHELTHRQQWAKDLVGFLPNYLTSRSKRANYWAEACKPQIEISMYRRGRTPSIALMIDNLKRNYYVRESDCRVARLYLEAFSTPVRDGAVATDIGKAAIAFMKSNGY